MKILLTIGLLMGSLCVHSQEITHLLPSDSLRIERKLDTLSKGYNDQLQIIDELTTDLSINRKDTSITKGILRGQLILIESIMLTLNEAKRTIYQLNNQDRLDNINRSIEGIIKLKKVVNSALGYKPLKSI